MSDSTSRPAARPGVLGAPGVAAAAALLYAMFYVVLTLAFGQEVIISALVVPIAALLLGFSAVEHFVDGTPRWLLAAGVATGIGAAVAVTVTTALV
jgi:ABC-type Fe3+-siderophore transport system permease subunit